MASDSCYRIAQAVGAVIRSVELNVQPDAHGVLPAAIGANAAARA